MGSFIIGLFTVILIVLSVFIVLIVLMQRASSNAGMGSALGGGAAESAFGGESGNILSRGTILAAVLFFVITFGLYLGHMYRAGVILPTGPGLPSIAEEMEEAAPAADLLGLSDLSQGETETAEGSAAPVVEEVVEVVENTDSAE